MLLSPLNFYASLNIYTELKKNIKTILLFPSVFSDVIHIYRYIQEKLDQNNLKNFDKKSHTDHLPHIGLDLEPVVFNKRIFKVKVKEKLALYFD